MWAPAEPEGLLYWAYRLSGRLPHWRDAELAEELDRLLGLELWRFRGRPNEWDTWREVHETLHGALDRTFQGVTPEGIPNVLVRLFEGEPSRFEVTLYDDHRPWVRGIAVELVPNPDGG